LKGNNALKEKSDPQKVKMKNSASMRFIRILTHMFLPSLVEIGERKLTKMMCGKNDKHKNVSFH